MLSFPPSVRIFVSTEPTDMRRSFDALAAQVERAFGQNPLSGHLFVFRNRSGDRLKILYWDRDGYALWYKRLEQGTFALPDHGGEIRSSDLALLLEGIDLSSVRRTKRFSPHVTVDLTQ